MTNPLSMYLYFLLILLPFLIMLIFRAKWSPGPKLPPGPFALPIIGNLHMLGHLPHRALAKLAQKYGPIMSLKLGHVRTVVVTSPKAIELLLKQNDAVFSNRPHLQVIDILSYGTKGVAFTRYGEYWRSMRRMMTHHLLTPAKVEGFKELRKREMEAEVGWLRRKGVAREVVDVGERVGELIEGIVFKMLIGKGKEEDKRYDVKGLVEEDAVLCGAFNLGDYIPYLAPLDLQGLTKKMKDLSRRIDEVLENIIEDHLKEEDFGQDRDILDAMLALMKNPNNEFMSSFNRDNVKALMLDLFVGGIDTSLVTSTWALSALLKHPRIMKLLRDELDSIVGINNMVSESDLSKLPFLDTVIKETFRLYPVAPLLVPRESTEDVIINGYMIPKQTRIIINIWGIGRDQTVWSENADQFDPERFIGKDIDIRGRDFELIPFGAGRRKCPGIQMGLLTVKLIVAQFVHCFNWELPNGMKPEEMNMNEEFGLSMPRANRLLAIPSYRLQV